MGLFPDGLGRKFMVMVLATFLVWFHRITPEVWGGVAAAFMFVTGAEKFIPGTPHPPTRSVTS